MDNATKTVNGSFENSERAYGERNATRRSNIEQVDREWRGQVRLAKVAFTILIVLFITLICGVITGARRVTIVGAVCFVLSAAFLFQVTQHINRLLRLRGQIVDADNATRSARERARRQREGIRARNERDTTVEGTEWNATNGVRTDWVEGEAQSLLPGDVVLKWDHRIQLGLCLERNGKIIAARLLGHIDW